MATNGGIQIGTNFRSAPFCPNTPLEEIAFAHSAGFDCLQFAVREPGDYAVRLGVWTYVHTSDGRPGWDTGSGWRQAATLTFAEGKIEGILPDLPADIRDGNLVMDGEVINNVIPIPLSHAGEVCLTLHLHSPVMITGERMVLTLIGAPVYVEEFPGVSPA